MGQLVGKSGPRSPHRGCDDGGRRVLAVGIQPKWRVGVGHQRGVRGKLQHPPVQAQDEVRNGENPPHQPQPTRQVQVQMGIHTYWTNGRYVMIVEPPTNRLAP